MKPKIIYTEYGIGNNFGEVIELNKNLLKYPNLHRSILSHEIRHNNSNFKKDLITDLGESKVSNIELLSFIIHHPKSLTQFLPIYWSKKWGFVYDLNLCLIYFISIIVMIFVYFITMKYIM